jgi:hypothetical protein
MNIELIRYLWLLLQTRGLQWSFVRVRATETGDRRHARRAYIHSKH